MSRKIISSRSRYAIAIFFAGILALTIGCQKKAAQNATDNKPVIPVSHPVEREVTDYADYTGRTDAVFAVNVVARASGYLLHTYFEEGADVKAGQLLFQIDPTQYEIAKESAEAQVESAKANIASSIAALNTSQANVNADNKAIGMSGKDVISDLQRLTDLENLNGAKAKLDASKAALKSADATLKNANLNLSYTEVTAPISGQISRYYYTQGNLISANSTLMTTIVSNDFIYAYFNIEDRVFEKIISEISRNTSLPKTPVDALAMRAVAGGMSGLTPLQLSNFPVLMAIEGQASLRGEVDQVRDNLITLNVGSDAGFIPGIALEVKRLTGGGSYLGTANVIDVQPKQATALFTPTRANVPLAQLRPEELPKKGDVVESSGFRYRGKLDFINNQVNPSTGTVAVRGLFKNVRQRGGLVTLIPGKFARIRLPLGGSHKSQLIIDRAIGSDQGLKYIYVLDGENKVQYRRVIPGALQEDGLRVIEPYKPKIGDEMESGVKPNERLVVGGLQQLKPRLVIEPNEIPMPTLASDSLKLKSPLSGLGGKEGGSKEGGKGAGEKGGAKGGNK